MCSHVVLAGDLFELKGMEVAARGLIFFGFASIPWCDTRKPSSLPAGTPKTLSGLSLACPEIAERFI